MTRKVLPSPGESDDPKSVDLAGLTPYLKTVLAQRSLIDFCRRMDPKFDAPPHIARIAQHLEDVEAGKTRRLFVNVPPGHGKSRLLQLFAGYYLGRDPQRKAITTANAATLTERNSRETRSLFLDDKFPFDVKLSTESSSVTQWSLDPGRGGMYAIGVEGKITGFRANLIIVDDAEHDASSEAERNTVWAWFTEVLMPRLEPSGAVVIIGTRWHEADLFGRLMDSPSATEWTKVIAPAIATEDNDDPFDRKPGEALWPTRWPREELDRRKLEIGDRAFQAQYQADPTPDAGVLVQRNWLANKYQPQAVKIDQFYRVLSVDSAWGKGPSSDWSAFCLWATDGIAFYLVDAAAAKLTYPDLRRELTAFQQRHRANAVLIEDTASGIALIQELKLTSGMPIVPVTPRGSKQSRLEMVLPAFESGRVRLPESAPWLDMWVDQHLRFPSGKHDDLVDCTTMALARLIEVSTRMSEERMRVPVDWMAR